MATELLEISNIHGDSISFNRNCGPSNLENRQVLTIFIGDQSRQLHRNQIKELVAVLIESFDISLNEVSATGCPANYVRLIEALRCLKQKQEIKKEGR